MRISGTREGLVTAVLRIRGHSNDAVELPCGGWEQVIQKARHYLPHFEQRNPWLYFDSRKQKLYVLLDPDTDPPIAHQSRRGESPARTVTKEGQHL